MYFSDLYSDYHHASFVTTYHTNAFSLVLPFGYELTAQPRNTAGGGGRIFFYYFPITV